MYIGNLRHSYTNLINIYLEFKEYATDKKIYKLRDEYQSLLKKDIKKLPLPFFQTKKNVIDQDIQCMTSVFFQSPRNMNASI